MITTAKHRPRVRHPGRNKCETVEGAMPVLAADRQRMAPALGTRRRCNANLDRNKYYRAMVAAYTHAHTHTHMSLNKQIGMHATSLVLPCVPTRSRKRMTPPRSHPLHLCGVPV